MAATAKARGAPARGRSGPGTLPPTGPGETAGEPDIIRLDEDPDGEPERVPVFAIGDDVYTMLADPPASLPLRAMEIAEQRGATQYSVGLADVYIMREMLGSEGYRALLNSKTLKRGQFVAITRRVMEAAMGALEDDGSPNR